MNFFAAYSILEELQFSSLEKVSDGLDRHCVQVIRTAPENLSKSSFSVKFQVGL